MLISSSLKGVKRKVKTMVGLGWLGLEDIPHTGVAIKM